MNKPALKERPYSRDEVVRIIQSVMTNVGNETELTQKLQEELQVLHDYIESMRAELAQMRSIEISHNHIPTATDELDAVVDETAKATGTIMDACDEIEKIGEGVSDEQRAQLTDVITRVYEACSFQDITGQRITKVVKTLKNIEAKVADILSAFGHGAPGAYGKAPAVKEQEGSGTLLNGPQVGGPAVNQAEIDKLLAEFDK
ncbi:MAG: protein phosphatase CheZ [Alphaproteobacteria bacterium]|nr:protein phosphatase CheZ [Alphaproteobacteria bacterium]